MMNLSTLRLSKQYMHAAESAPIERAFKSSIERESSRTFVAVVSGRLKAEDDFESETDDGEKDADVEEKWCS